MSWRASANRLIVNGTIRDLVNTVVLAKYCGLRTLLLWMGAAVRRVAVCKIGKSLHIKCLANQLMSIILCI